MSMFTRESRLEGRGKKISHLKDVLAHYVYGLTSRALLGTLHEGIIGVRKMSTPRTRVYTSAMTTVCTWDNCWAIWMDC